MKTKLVWRLTTVPTVEEVTKLLEAGVITKEEAKELILRDKEEVPTDQLKEIKDELKLLRELVLANLGAKQVEIIHRYYDTTWYKQPMSYPQTFPTIYCTSAGIGNITGGTLTNNIS